MRNKQSLIAFVVSSVFVVAFSFWVHKWDAWESQKLITWDCAGYYLYLPGFFYDDLGELHNRQYIIETYHPSGTVLSDHIGPIGKHVIKYSCGMAVMYLPGFIAGHVYAKLANYPVDGFSYPYQFSMAMYSLLVTLFGLWLCRKLLLKYFSDTVTAFVLLCLVLATNYLNYGAASNMFSHNYLFTVYTAIILISIQWHKTFDYKNTLLLGFLCGLSALSRPTEVISVIIPFLWGVGNIDSLKERIQKFSEHKKHILLLLFVAVAVGSVQFIYWKVCAGKFLYWSYADSDDKLDFLHVHFAQCMYSYKKGWLVYTPFMLLSIIGLIHLYKKDRRLFVPVFSFVVVAFYIVFSWKNWSYGGSFSMRAVVQYYALLVFPIAALFEFVWNRKIWLMLIAPFVFFCIWLNLIMHYQANFGGMESDNMSKAYYWKIFGKLKVDKTDRKFIDTDEEMSDEKASSLQPLMQRVFCADSTTDNCVEFKGSKTYFMQKGIEFLPETRIDISEKKGRWYRITCEVFMVKDEPEYWTQPQLYAWLSDEKLKDIKQKNYRIQRVATFSDWDKMTIDILIPSDSKGKFLKAGIYNPKGGAKFYVRSLRIDWTEE